MAAPAAIRGIGQQHRRVADVLPLGVLVADHVVHGLPGVERAERRVSVVVQDERGRQGSFLMHAGVPVDVPQKQPLDAAVAAQEQALRELDGQQFEEAAGSQQTAAQEIRKLLESEPAPAADDTDDAATDTNPETSDKDAAAGGDKESQEGPAPEPDAAAAAEPADETPALSTGEDPRDILDEERQQRVRRQQRQRRLRPVERDW